MRYPRSVFFSNVHPRSIAALRRSSSFAWIRPLVRRTRTTITAEEMMKKATNSEASKGIGRRLVADWPQIQITRATEGAEVEHAGVGSVYDFSSETSLQTSFDPADDAWPNDSCDRRWLGVFRHTSCSPNNAYANFNGNSTINASACPVGTN